MSQGRVPNRLAGALLTAVGLGVAQPSVAGVCCVSYLGACLDASDGITEADCTAGGGTWIAGPGSCPTDGACLCGEISDCNAKCAPLLWLGDADCDDGGWVWHGNVIHLDCIMYSCDYGDCDPATHPDCLPPQGACCLADGSCQEATQADCTAASGNYWGDGAPCAPNPCPQAAAGACCLGDGTCVEEAQASCTAASGDYQGDGTLCSPNPCPQPPTGACCLDDGSCAEEKEAQCTAASGDYQGDETLCDPDPCPPRGACCLADGSCAKETESGCTATGGDYWGDAALCDPNPCPPPPACAYKLTTAGEGRGTVVPNPAQTTYDCGAEVHLTATADLCWHFVRWEGALTDTISPATLTMDADQAVTAIFAEDRFALSVDVQGAGQVERDPPPAGDDTYACRTTVHLTATADPGAHFVRWSGDASGANNGTSVVMSRDCHVTAIFEQGGAEDAGPFTLTVTITGEGSIRPSGGTYDAGATVELTATPSSGWHFVRWEDDATGYGLSSTVVMTSDRNVTAVFEADDAPPVTPGDGGQPSSTGLPEETSKSPFGGACPAGGAGLIGLLLAGLLRSRAPTGHRPSNADRVAF
jgi:hypothetical protein